MNLSGKKSVPLALQCAKFNGDCLLTRKQHWTTPHINFKLCSLKYHSRYSTSYQLPIVVLHPTRQRRNSNSAGDKLFDRCWYQEKLHLLKSAEVTDRLQYRKIHLKTLAFEGDTQISSYFLSHKEYHEGFNFLFDFCRHPLGDILLCLSDSHAFDTGDNTRQRYRTETVSPIKRRTSPEPQPAAQDLSYGWAHTIYPCLRVC